MRLRTFVLGSAALLAAASCAGTAYAYSEAEVIHLDELCRRGDRAACAQRETAIHDHDHETEWRLHHPEWYR
jgi:hypothetical protein